jgi:hypothetical protein
MSHYLDSGPADKTELLILLALADWANDEGLAFPSKPKLARRARISPRTLQRYLPKLENDGWIDRKQGDGRGHKSLYQLKRKGDIVTPFVDGKGDSVSPFIGVKGDIATPFEADKGRQNDALKGDKIAKNVGPFNSLTVINEPSVKPPYPPNAGDSPETVTLAKLLVLATPISQRNRWNLSDVPDRDWRAGIEAARAESAQNGMSLNDALENLRHCVESQVREVPPERWQYIRGALTNEIYFRERIYRASPETLRSEDYGKSNGTRIVEAMQRIHRRDVATQVARQNGNSAGWKGGPAGIAALSRQSERDAVRAFDNRRMGTVQVHAKRLPDGS